MRLHIFRDRITTTQTFSTDFEYVVVRVVLLNPLCLVGPLQRDVQQVRGRVMRLGREEEPQLLQVLSQYKHTNKELVLCVCVCVCVCMCVCVR